ncbi:hypothetical protein TELCIR_10446 [Teladorsagia circumcincta]|uniref:Uncharacterized protein n=1 Tax=Teladorsagia circumcincta TaxID=45464 RepID=A0A2G9UC29_TELCI|nr:hypothetical protein TELCIR_10446 [Teladorsagia circumcincta]
MVIVLVSVGCEWRFPWGNRDELFELGLKESDTCKKAFLGSPTSYCNYVGEYGNTSCPSQSTAGYLVVLEYFVLLKLILWPILFAFFAKTAKSVDEEADKIWKYQMYSLVTEFSLRPPLPPPLTPLFFFCMACCRAGGQLGGMMSTYPDHPDVDHRERGRSNVRFGSVYRNPSVPAKKNEFVNSFWRQLMIDRWREETQVKSEDIGNADTKIIQMELIPYADTDIKRLSVPSMERSWQVLLPRYSPPFYCRPAEEFPTDTAKHVEVATEQVFSMRRLDSSIIDSSETVPATDTSPAHIARLAIEHDIDTDHAWTEHDLWAISLR